MDFIAAVLLAHLIGDYVLQNQWMADNKTKRLWPAIVHGAFYTLPFLLITLNPWSLLIIFGTHVVIDRYRLAKYIIWFKNQLAPKSSRFAWSPSKAIKTARASTSPPIVTSGSTGPLDASILVTGTIAGMKVISVGDGIKNPSKINDKNTGFPMSVPDWMRVWLMIIVDNTLHLVLNVLAIWLFL